MVYTINRTLDSWPEHHNFNTLKFTIYTWSPVWIQMQILSIGKHFRVVEVKIYLSVSSFLVPSQVTSHLTLLFSISKLNYIKCNLCPFQHSSSIVCPPLKKYWLNWCGYCTFLRIIRQTEWDESSGSMSVCRVWSREYECDTMNSVLLQWRLMVLQSTNRMLFDECRNYLNFLYFYYFFHPLTRRYFCNVWWTYVSLVYRPCQSLNCFIRRRQWWSCWWWWWWWGWCEAKVKGALEKGEISWVEVEGISMVHLINWFDYASQNFPLDIPPQWLLPILIKINTKMCWPKVLVLARMGIGRSEKR